MYENFMRWNEWAQVAARFLGISKRFMNDFWSISGGSYLVQSQFSLLNAL